jgi:hypothetical protein
VIDWMDTIMDAGLAKQWINAVTKPSPFNDGYCITHATI